MTVHWMGITVMTSALFCIKDFYIVAKVKGGRMLCFEEKLVCSRYVADDIKLCELKSKKVLGL